MRHASSKPTNDAFITNNSNDDDATDGTVKEDNYAIFRDCVADIVIERLAPQPTAAKKKRTTKARKNQIKPVERSAEEVEETRGNDAEELGDFIEYIASDLFDALPPAAQTLTYAATRSSPDLDALYTPPLPLSTLEAIALALPASTLDSLTTYALLPSPHDTHDLLALLTPLLTSYFTTTTTPPPSTVLPHTASQRPDGCELCERDWIPLTYHHLIPRAMHAKSLKRGWHEEWELANVAWLCRACHSFVHRTGNEELAREWYTVERLRGREDVEAFARWIGKVRWKKR